MAEQGGYRAPSNPAPVSGPGALSQRTDVQSPMQIPDAAYGEQAEFQEIQGGADMMGGGGMPPVGLLEPSQRPGEPVTAGAAMGAGPGMEALGIQEQTLAEMEQIRAYMPMLRRMAGRVDAPRSFRALVSFIDSYPG